MDLVEFSKVNKERCESENGFNHKLNEWSNSDWITAITGELGEAANLVKKLNRVRDNIPGNKETKEELEEKLVNELADTFIYLDLMIQSLNQDTSNLVKYIFNCKSKQIGYDKIL